MFRRVCAGLGVALSVAACAPMSLDFLWPQARWQAQTHGLEPLNRVIGPQAPSLDFSFEFDDQADAAEGEVGSGYILVSQDGKELQALPHAFELPAERLDSANWLDFRDYNGDGLLDFKVTRLYVMDGKVPVDSLYQFDPKTGRFAQVDSVSNAGAIRHTTPQCVALKVITPSGLPKPESHCFDTAAGRWERVRLQAMPVKPAPARTEAGCDGEAPDLVACRRARIEQDKSLLTLVRHYRGERAQALRAEQGPAYARAYAQTLDLDHRRWRQHRDTRCAVQARDEAVPELALPAAVERCRLEWSRDQMRRYRDQMARLDEGTDRARQ